MPFVLQSLSAYVGTADIVGITIYSDFKKKAMI